MVRILVADDHAIFREALRSLLETEPDFEVVAEAGDGNEAVALVLSEDPDILLLDVRMPVMSGLETLEALSRLGVRTQTILLTAAIETTGIRDALACGARGLVMKGEPTTVLLRGIRSVLNGEYCIGRGGLGAVLGEPAADAPDPPDSHPYGLSDRELQVVAGVMDGCSNVAIATSLSISDKTVKHHLTNIFDKLGIATRVQLARFVREHQLAIPDHLATRH